MGLRNREPEPLRNGRQSSSGSYWNRGISAHGCAGFSTCISIVAVTVAAAPASGAGSWFTMNELGKLLLFAGLILVAGGLILMLFGRTNLPLGRLPGDIIYRGKNTTFYFPLATSILLSVVLSVILYLVGRLKRQIELQAIS